jgi:hypothetical protein
MKKTKRMAARMRNMSEGFPLLFDPRTPVLFVLGGVLLSMVSSACYDLLLLWLGESWLTYVITGLGSVVLLAGVVLAIYVVASTHKRPSTILGPEERASQRPGLVLFLSPGTGKADEQALRWHQPRLQHVWLLFTDEVERDGKVERLVADCRQKDVQVYPLRITNPRDAEEARAVVSTALAEAERRGLKRGDLYVDITSCLRPSAVGATLACSQTRHDIEYMVSHYEKGQLVSEKSEAMEITLSAPPSQEGSV